MSYYLFEYSRDYDPAAPVIEVVLSTKRHSTRVITAFVDSGADGTTVPLQFLRQLRARYTDQRILSGITGKGLVVGLYSVQIQIGSDVIYGTQVAGYGEEVILGRDVLNQLSVLLNGPALVAEITI